MERPILLALYSLFITIPNFAFAHDIELSGFVRVVGGQTLANQDTLGIYDNDFSVKPDSIVGLQIDKPITNKLSATAQVTGKLDDENRSGIEWLYLSYRVNNAFKLKVGRLRTSFFSYSDVLDVGYAYHWVKPPTEVYASFFFTNFDGVSASYDWVGKTTSSKIEGFYGQFDDEVNFEGIKFAPDVNNYRGVVGTHEIDKLKLRASYFKADVSVKDNRLDILRASLTQLDQYQAVDFLGLNGPMTYYQLGASYEQLDYFIHAEWVKLTHDFKLINTASSYYLSAGYILDDYTFHITFANRNDNAVKAIPAVTLPLIPEFTPLITSYQNITNDIRADDQSSWQLGVRWDFTYGMAMKGELKRTHFKLPIQGKSEYINSLYFAFEWVF